ncbi:hypothetical protein APY94_00235 [Thermococcus celericrescens]|uniref:Uncharacterized protein n=1 Tax=Thermococcus celericrescens TaxID=227598 RepID=A0A117IU27_9EURY|nr:hypothetical protein [Thermococcus celericrescens]KUH34837.1 hypothetical protein APY94_00235 [Thermococcus celericrescens]
MVKIELHTEVEESVPAEDVPGFVIKKIDLGGIHLETPVRTLYLGTDVSARARSKILDLKERKATLFEVNRTIYLNKSYDSIIKAIKESDDDNIRDTFKLSEKLANYNIALPISFSKFPQKVFGMEYFERFLDYLHEYSTVLFVPHVRFARETSATAVNYDAQSFVRYVDGAVEVLNEWNTKPIFVPLDIDYPAETTKEIISHYAKRGYTNIWVDFKGHTFTKSRSGRMRSLKRLIDDLFGEESKNVIIYISNIKKTQREHPKEVKLKPSDIFGTFVYGDIVGIPWKGIVWPPKESDANTEEYWIKKGFPSKEEYEEAVFKRDTGIFDTNSYYYLHPDKINLHDSILDRLREEVLSMNIRQKSVAEKISHSISNAITLRELNRLKSKVLSEGTIQDYLESREYFATAGKTMLASISTKPRGHKTSKKKTLEKPRKNLFDFMDSP